MIDRYFGDKQGFYWAALVAVALQLCSTIVALALFGWQRPSKMSVTTMTIYSLYGAFSWPFITGIVTSVIAARFCGTAWPSTKWLGERAGLVLESTAVVTLVTVLPVLAMLVLGSGGAASVIGVLLPVVGVVVWVITACVYIILPLTAAFAASQKLHFGPALTASTSYALSKPGLRTLGLAALVMVAGWLVWWAVARVGLSKTPLTSVYGAVTYAAMSLVFAASVAQAAKQSVRSSTLIT